METFEIRNLSFSYPGQTEKAIDDLSLTINEGEVIVICGPSGCGKSTLLRHLKSVLTPHGTKNGEIRFKGTILENVEKKVQAQKIGFVQQSADNQIVTDKVWHELAFGMESLGYDNETIRRRVAETAMFFGIESWFYKKVTELSGGQKQLLALASVMVMQPSVLILDEPTSQLDPIAASEFFSLLVKINRELGTGIVLTEHRLEEVFSMAHRAAVMDEGKLICVGSVREIGDYLRRCNHKMFLSMPAAMRIWSETDSISECPITVQEGKKWLKEFSERHILKDIHKKEIHTYSDEVLLKADELWFRYEKNAKDVVKGLSLEIRKAEFFALLGGNGAGKSTTLKLFAGLIKPYRGNIDVKGKIGFLPQNPQSLFLKKNVWEDLNEVIVHKAFTSDEKKSKISEVILTCHLKELLDRHPYDLSGGEQQRLALAKVMLTEPDIMLLDEPTKGFDAEFKVMFAHILTGLIKKGIAVLMVSHDIEFCAKYAHCCGMFFDGRIINKAEPHMFFLGNSFYTTAANRIARDIVTYAITTEEVVEACGGENIDILQTEMEEATQGFRFEYKEKKCDKWHWFRKIAALVSGTGLTALFIKFISETNLSEIVNQDGLGTQAKKQMIWHIAFLVLVAIFASCVIGKRQSKYDPVKMEKSKPDKQMLISIAFVLLIIPLTLFIAVKFVGNKSYYGIALIVILEIMIPFVMSFEKRKPKAREVVVLSSLCAIAVAGRTAFFMFPQFKPVMAVVIVTGVAFGAESGFLVGALTMLVSNMMFSQGPWLPWQMFAMGMIGFLSGILFQKRVLKCTRMSLCTFGFVSAVFIYGGIMNPAAALMSMSDVNMDTVIAYYLTGLPVDCVQGIATWMFLWFGGEAMLEKLERIKTKYGIEK